MNKQTLTPFLSFDYKGKSQIRIIMRQGEPWFVAADVCRVLEIPNPTVAIASLDEDEKDQVDNLTLCSTEGHSRSRGGAQVYNIISESGIYALAFKSRKPQAKAFRKWTTSEVIPSIRKTGGYGPGLDPATLPAIMGEAMRIALQPLMEQAEETRCDVAELRQRASCMDMSLMRVSGRVRDLEIQKVQTLPLITTRQVEFWEGVKTELQAGRLGVRRYWGLVTADNRLEMRTGRMFRGAEELVMLYPLSRWSPLLRRTGLREGGRVMPRQDQSHKIYLKERRICGCLCFRRNAVPGDVNIF